MAPLFAVMPRQRLRNLKTELGTKCSIILHSPLAVSGNDPLPVAQDERMLLCQLFLPDDRMPADVASEIAAGLSGLEERRRSSARSFPRYDDRTVESGQSRRSPRRRRKRFPSSCNTTARPRIRKAFHDYYRSHHVPIVFRMPGIRAVAYHLPTQLAGPAIGDSVSRLQIVQAVFNSSDDFVAMRKSGERKEGLRDFENYPKFEGPVTHQVMDSRRID